MYLHNSYFIPLWAVPYLRDGDASELCESFRHLADHFLAGLPQGAILDISEDRTFCNCPAIGMSCWCVTCDVFTSEDNPEHYDSAAAVITWITEKPFENTYTILVVNGEKTNVYWSTSDLVDPCDIQRQRAEFLAAEIAAGNITATNWEGWDPCRLETVIPKAAEILPADAWPDYRNAVTHCRTYGQSTQESLQKALTEPTYTQLIKRIKRDADGRYLYLLDKFGAIVGPGGYALYYI